MLLGGAELVELVSEQPVVEGDGVAAQQGDDFAQPLSESFIRDGVADLHKAFAERFVDFA
ncbi:hypothetical protein JCM3263A_22570 [Thermobifida fusca]